jgi:hypothetical protein
MTNKRWFLLCVLSLLAVSTLYRAYCATSAAKPAPAAALSRSPTLPVATAVGAPAHPAVIAVAAAPIPPAVEPADLAPPDVAEILHHAAVDPHTTPPELLQFAADLAPRMATALGDEPTAQQLFSSLEACALPGARPTARTARALCLSDAALLSENHATLRQRYAQLEARIEPDIVKLAQ